MTTTARSSQLAAKLSVPVTAIEHQMTIWGNHSATQYPDLFTRRGQRPAARPSRSSEGGSTDTFIPTVAKRGAAIIEARGASSAASAANAAIDHVYDWVNGTGRDWVSAGVVSDGSYGVPEGLDLARSRSPLRAASGRSSRASTIDDFSRGQDRRLGRRARRRARRRQGSRPDLTAGSVVASINPLPCRR